VDALVVDEASMVDLLLMDAVLDALDPGARLILLGDRDQLASVETGFVFGDLCAAADLGAGVSPGFADFCRRLGAGELATATVDTGPAPPLRDAAVELEVSYRFRSQRGIGALAAAVRRGDADGALEVLADPGFADVERLDPPAVVEELLAPILGELDHCLDAGSPAEALERLDRFRILGATRRGVLGIERLNAAVERHLLRLGLPAAESWYRGRPLLVTANDYQVRLYNGDLGVAWPDAGRSPGDEGRLHAWFRDGEALRRLPLAKLPAHETAWAMTVHKSQGSELDRVLLVLPVADSAVLTRELLYTGLTRARRRVHLVATPETVRRAVERPSRRRSGLATALRPACEPAAPSTPPSDPEPPEPPASGQLSLF
jgi:exodeoxyribonuclease V alpha subunit